MFDNLELNNYVCQKWPKSNNNVKHCKKKRRIYDIKLYFFRTLIIIETNKDIPTEIMTNDMEKSLN